MATYFCRYCGRDTTHLDILHAAKLAGVSRETIYYWIKKMWIHGIEFPSGRMKLCVESLLRDRGPE